jgi:hypothetical protein
MKVRINPNANPAEITITIDAEELLIIRNALNDLHDNSDEDREASICRALLKDLPRITISKTIKLNPKDNATEKRNG